MTSSQSSLHRKRRILIVDDHPIVRRGFRELIADEADLELCGEAEDVEDALRMAQELRPDIAVVDLSLKSGRGLDLIHQMRSCLPNTRVLVSTMHDEVLFAERALRAGAAGFIGKQEPPEKMVEAIRQVACGEIWLSPRMAGRLLARIGSPSASPEDVLSALSDRELQVFEMIGRGLSTAQIATQLDVSIKTVETHRQRIKVKLGLRTGAELNRYAVQWSMR